ncbi:MAG: cyclase family protein [Bacteroidota bacterium]
MKIIIFILIVLFTGCDQPTKRTSLAEQFAKGKCIDLSHDFSKETIYWPNNPTGFKLDTQFNGITARGFYYSSNAFSSPEHGGTHLDAPVHFAKGKWSVDEIPLQQLIGEAVVVDVADKTKNNADYQISSVDIEAWEKRHDQIPDDAILLFKTGWSKFYPDPEKYLGTAEKGQEAVSKLHFPSIHPTLAEWLVKNRKIKAVGIDCASVDYGQSVDFKTHQLLYAQNIVGFENLTNLDQLPAKGSFIIALPMKIKEGTGAPLRVIAWVE